ncbi:MAG TPA: ADOP family duplicated permease [Acidobacteriota bacterium]|nr:ADOP family duplicated permease [Acidobacteriota bacterium]
MPSEKKPHRRAAALRLLLGYYRWLLRLYPAGFRRRYGAEMQAQFRHQARTRLQAGGAAAFLAVFLRITLDSLLEAMRRRAGQTARLKGEAPSWSWLGDVRYSLRSLRRNPLWTLAILLLLALGIGANTAIFSTASSVLLAPLPLPDSQRLLLVENLFKGEIGPQVAFHDFRDIKAASPSLAHGAMALWYAGTLQREGGAERLNGFRVTPDFFSTIGAGFALGSGFSEKEALDDQSVVISHRLWRSRFGASQDILGSSLVIDGQSRTVKGVLARGVDLPYPRPGNDLWLPLSDRHNLAQSRAIFTFFAFVRLRPQATLQGFEKELEAIAMRLQDAYPETNAGRSYAARPLLDAVVGDIRSPLWMLFVSVTALLLLVCANVANLLLARFGARRHELSVRAALGAGRIRLMAQLLWESLLLSLAGALAGLLLARGVLVLLPQLAPPGVPRLEEVSLSPTMLLYALGLALLTTLAFGLVPAWKAGRARGRAALSPRVSRGAGGSSSPLRSGLVVVELALALSLTVGAGLLISSFAQVLAQPPGFRLDSTLTWRVSLPPGRYPDMASVLTYQQRLSQEVEALPGARRLAFSTSLPLSGHDTGSALSIQGAPAVPLAELPSVRWQAVSPGAFRASGIPLLEGRTFQPSDLPSVGPQASAAEDATGSARSSPHLVVVNQALARRHFPQGALGRRIELGVPGGDWHEIIGVVGNVRHRTLEQAPEPRAYDLFGQHGSLSFFAILHTEGDPAALIEPVRAQVAALDPQVPAYELLTMRERLGSSLAVRRFLLTLLAALAVLALLLSALGVYGLLAFAVQERRGEIGIRLALGARPGDVRRLMLGRGAYLAILGIAIGLPAAWAVTRLFSAQLFAVSPADPYTLAMSSLLLVLVALTATYLPARRASLLHPQETLRE